MRHFLCLLWFHHWNKINDFTRKCAKCYKTQKLVDEGYTNGMSDYKFWVTEK